MGVPGERFGKIVHAQTLITLVIAFIGLCGVTHFILFLHRWYDATLVSDRNAKRYEL